jgi:hypothetical protein
MRENKNAIKMNAATLLSTLEKTGHTPPERHERLASSIQVGYGEPELPIYLRILAGIGAFIASLCLMGFLSLSHLIDFNSGMEMIAWGVMFVTGGIALSRLAARNAGVALHSFLMQWSFCLVGLGKILAVGGAMELDRHGHGYAYAYHHNELWYGMFMLSAVTAVAWPFYRMSVDRFLSSLAVLVMLTSAVVDDLRLAGTLNFALQGLALAELAGVALIFTIAGVSRSLRPLGYALAIMLSGITLFYSFQPRHATPALSLSHEVFDPSILEAALIAAFVALTGWAAGGLNRLRQEPFLIAGLGVAALALIGAPGVILALGFLVLGYALHDRTLIRGGALLAPVFLWMYYYNLDLTLLAKSTVLVASGAVLLAGRAYMHYRNFDKEVPTP